MTEQIHEQAFMNTQCLFFDHFQDCIFLSTGLRMDSLRSNACEGVVFGVAFEIGIIVWGSSCSFVAITVILSSQQALKGLLNLFCFWQNV